MREGNKLTALRVLRLKEPGRYSDGHGLWLQVSDTGTKAWLFRYMRDGRARQMGLGPLHTVSLAEARDRARHARQLLLDDHDPIETKRRGRDDARAAAGDRMLFKDAALRFLELHEPTWKNEKHRWQWQQTLEAHAFPKLGGRPVAAVDGALITDALAPIWQTMPETARRTKQRILRVCKWVKDGMPLPAHGIRKRVQHHPAISFEEVPEFMAELRKREGISARALELTVLTAARTNDTIGAKWVDIDLDAGVWRIADEWREDIGAHVGRHKTGKNFEIPLSKRAIETLRELPRERGNPYVFIGGKAKQPLSNAAMAELLKGMHKARAVSGLAPWADRSSGRLAVPHGFRSSFRDWAGDRTNFAREVIEAAMSHQIKDKAEAAYRRSAALEKRRRLMNEWARFCSLPSATGGTVVAIRS